MGELMLSTLLTQLRGMGLKAGLAYPGRRISEISETVAAVHIRKADPLRGVLTVEVAIISPETVGGTACELESLRIMEMLCRNGVVCTQSGCEYDSQGRIYTVSILAEYHDFFYENYNFLGTGFRLYIGAFPVDRAVSFTLEKTADVKRFHEMGQDEPVEVRRGSWMWKLELEELLPLEEVGFSGPQENFTLKIQGKDGAETYTGCCWTSVSYEYTPGGVRRIRSGYALRKESGT